MKKSRQGFTLVEMLLTLGVLAIGLTSIFTLLPGVTQFSRELRDQDRMQTFAEAVFASIEWQLESGGDVPDVVSAEDKLELPRILGTQALVISDQEQAWPDTGMAVELVPVMYYTLQLQSNSVREVEVTLQLRPESRIQARTFTRTIYPQVQAW